MVGVVDRQRIITERDARDVGVGERQFLCGKCSQAARCTILRRSEPGKTRIFMIHMREDKAAMAAKMQREQNTQ